MSAKQEKVSPIGRQYKRQSFDRFGDHLSELILSYLTLEDQSRLECVSKQFQRSVYVKLTDIRLFPFDLPNTETMRKFFAKCPNIKSIEFPNLNDSVLDIITDCCPRLESMTFDVYYVTLDGINRFGERMGPKLRHIDFNVSANANRRMFRTKSGKYLRILCQTLLSMCPNVESLAYNDFLSLDFSDQQLVPKLQELGHSVVRFDSEEHMLAFNHLADKYENSIKRLLISFQFDYNPSVQSLAAMLALIPRFTRLEVLDLRFDNIHAIKCDIKDIMKKDLQELIKKLTNLKKLHLNFGNFELDFDIFESVEGLQDLRQLKINCPKAKLLSKAVDNKPLKNLKKVNIECQDIDQHFLCNIPNVETLKLCFTNANSIPENLINNLSKLKHLSKITISFKDISNENIIVESDAKESEIINLLDNCPKLKTINFLFGAKITSKTIDKLINLANNRPKERIVFDCYVEDVKAMDSDDDSQTHSLLSGVSLPSNLSINL